MIKNFKIVSLKFYKTKRIKFVKVKHLRKMMTILVIKMNYKTKVYLS